jgi:hypothetical protein
LVSSLNKETIKETIRLNNNAHQKLSTPNPEIKEPATKIIIALITKRNRPKVMMVNGIVINTRIGRRVTFNNEITPATIKTVPISDDKWIPGNRYAVNATAAAVIKIFIMNFTPDKIREQKYSLSI